MFRLGSSLSASDGPIRYRRGDGTIFRIVYVSDCIFRLSRLTDQTSFASSPLNSAVTSSAGLDGEAVREVQVLDRFSFLSVPATEADRVIEALDGGTVHGRTVSLERVKLR